MKNKQDTTHESWMSGMTEEEYDDTPPPKITVKKKSKTDDTWLWAQDWGDE